MCYRGQRGWRRRALQGCVTAEKPRQSKDDRGAGCASPLPGSQVQGTEGYSAISNGFHSVSEHQSQRNLEVQLVIHKNKKPHASCAAVTQNKRGLLSAAAAAGLPVAEPHRHTLHEGFSNKNLGQVANSCLCAKWSLLRSLCSATGAQKAARDVSAEAGRWLGAGSSRVCCSLSSETSWSLPTRSLSHPTFCSWSHRAPWSWAWISCLYQPHLFRIQSHRQGQPRASSSFLSSPWIEKQRDFSLISVWFCFDDCTPQTGIFCNSYCNILMKCNIMDLCLACQSSSGKAHEGDQAMGVEISSWYFAGNEGPLINVKNIESIPVKI